MKQEGNSSIEYVSLRNLPRPQFLTELLTQSNTTIEHLNVSCLKDCGLYGFVKKLPTGRPLIGYYTEHKFVIRKSPKWNRGEFPHDDDHFDDKQILQGYLLLSDKEDPVPVKKTFDFRFKVYFAKSRFKSANYEKLEAFQLYSKTDKSMSQTSFIFKCQGDYYS